MQGQGRVRARPGHGRAEQDQGRARRGPGHCQGQNKGTARARNTVGPGLGPVWDMQGGACTRQGQSQAIERRGPAPRQSQGSSRAEQGHGRSRVEAELGPRHGHGSTRTGGKVMAGLGHGNAWSTPGQGQKQDRARANAQARDRAWQEVPEQGWANVGAGQIRARTPPSLALALPWPRPLPGLTLSPALPKPCSVCDQCFVTKILQETLISYFCTFLVEMGFHSVVQAGSNLPSSRHPPSLASQSAGSNLAKYLTSLGLFPMLGKWRCHKYLAHRVIVRIDASHTYVFTNFYS